MKIVQILILLGILIFLGAAIIIVDNPWGKDERTKKVESAKKLFPSFDVDVVTKIEITADSTTTILTKSGGQWLVESMDNYPADQQGVNDILEKAGEFPILSPGTELFNVHLRISKALGRIHGPSGYVLASNQAV